MQIPQSAEAEQLLHLRVHRDSELLQSRPLQLFCGMDCSHSGRESVGQLQLLEGQNWRCFFHVWLGLSQEELYRESICEVGLSEDQRAKSAKSLRAEGHRGAIRLHRAEPQGTHPRHLLDQRSLIEEESNH